MLTIWFFFLKKGDLSMIKSHGWRRHWMAPHSGSLCTSVLISAADKDRIKRTHYLREQENKYINCSLLSALSTLGKRSGINTWETSRCGLAAVPGFIGKLFHCFLLLQSFVDPALTYKEAWTHRRRCCSINQPTMQMDEERGAEGEAY